jgi:hypothetical protein
MAPEKVLAVEVVYALPGEQVVIPLLVPFGTTVEAAIELSGLPARFPGSSQSRVGIHGREVSRETVLREGDRVEIYRPLVADAKQARRRRAARSA